jgi:hypothetical protein
VVKAHRSSPTALGDDIQQLGHLVYISIIDHDIGVDQRFGTGIGVHSGDIPHTVYNRGGEIWDAPEVIAQRAKTIQGSLNIDIIIQGHLGYSLHPIGLMIESGDQSDSHRKGLPGLEQDLLQIWDEHRLSAADETHIGPVVAET